MYYSSAMTPLEYLFACSASLYGADSAFYTCQAYNVMFRRSSAHDISDSLLDVPETCEPRHWVIQRHDVGHQWLDPPPRVRELSSLLITEFEENDDIQLLCGAVVGPPHDTLVILGLLLVGVVAIMWGVLMGLSARAVKGRHPTKRE